MLITHEPHKDYKAAVEAAIAKAKATAKGLKTFEVEADPIVKVITKDANTVTEVSLKATGADKNYGQFTINYLKGEIEGHGNAASDVFVKLWKSQHMPKGDDVSPWIGRKTYPTIVETLTGQPNDPEKVGYGLLKGKTYDPDDLEKWDRQRQTFEETLKAKAAAIISAVRGQYNAAIVLMATMNGKIEYKDLEKDFVSKVVQHHEKTKEAAAYDSEVESQTIEDKKAELDYIEKTLPTTQGTIHLFHKLQDLIKASGDLDYMRQQAKAMEEAKPLIEGSVKDYNEQQAKAEKAQKRADSKADKDKIKQEAVITCFKYGMPAAVIAQAQQISQAKAEEILTAAGYDPAKPYSEQEKAE